MERERSSGVAQHLPHLIQLRHQYAALRNSRVDWLHNSDETNLVTFLRADDKDELLVVINFSDHPITGKVDLNNVDGFVPVEISGVQSSEGGPLPMSHLNGYEWRIYHRAPIQETLCQWSPPAGIKTVGMKKHQKLPVLILLMIFVGLVSTAYAQVTVDGTLSGTEGYGAPLATQTIKHRFW